MPGGHAIRYGDDGWTHVDLDGFGSALAHDLPEATQRVLAAAQGPTHIACLTTPARASAWRTLPSHYVLATEDAILDPELQQRFAERIAAPVTRVRASHLALMPPPPPSRSRTPSRSPASSTAQRPHDPPAEESTAACCDGSVADVSAVMLEWNDLFVMTGGAAAALAGLIFVAVSLNHEHVLQNPVLPAIAAQTLGLLIGLVLLSIVVLTPGQPDVVVGVEVLLVGVGLFAFVLVASLRTRQHDLRRWWTASRILLGALATLPAITAGGLLTLGVAGGRYALSVEAATAIAVAVYYAWILLIEVRR